MSGNRMDQRSQIVRDELNQTVLGNVVFGRAVARSTGQDCEADSSVVGILDEGGEWPRGLAFAVEGDDSLVIYEADWSERHELSTLCSGTRPLSSIDPESDYIQEIRLDVEKARLLRDVIDKFLEAQA